MTPDFNVMLDVLNRKTPSRIPFYEHFVDAEVVAEIQKEQYPNPPETAEEAQRRTVQFYADMGYDYVPVDIQPGFAHLTLLDCGDTAEYSRGERHWVDTQEGKVQTWEYLEDDANWPTGDKAFDYAGFEKLGAMLPPGMKLIGGASGGPFEHASFLMGLEPLSFKIYEDPAFVERLLERVGNTLVEIAARLVQYDFVGCYRFGDDMGYKTSTMLSPDVFRQFFFPWIKKVVEVSHKAGKHFILHSCGQLDCVMPDLIDDVKIDARHSYEDVITPVADFKAKWGNRIAILGGVDVDYLCRHTKEEVRDYTLRILEKCAPGGGYALGSGNTIANYVPIENYLAMMAAGREFNGR